MTVSDALDEIEELVYEATGIKLEDNEALEDILWAVYDEGFEDGTDSEPVE